jgi:predicted nucleotidyltransferase
MIGKKRFMKSLEVIKLDIKRYEDELSRIYCVNQIEIFGAYARGEQKEESDLDVLVEFNKPVSLLDVVGLEIFFSETLKIKVDVVLRRSVRSELKEIIFNEAILVLSKKFDYSAALSP